MGNFFYSRYIDRYASKTSHLTMLQHGAYTLLLDHYYKTAEPIPEDSAQIIRVSKAHSVEEIEAVTYILKSFFQLKNGVWRNRVADDELVRMRKLSKLRGELGKKGGLARAKAIAQANCVANPLANGQQKGSDLKTLRPNTKTPTKRASRLPEDFIPKPEHYELAASIGVIVDMELPKFRDHFLGTGGVKFDWDRTFNNWLRNSIKYRGGNGQNQRVVTGQNIQSKPRPTVAHTRFGSNVRVVGAAAAGLGGPGGSSARTGSGGMANQTDSGRSGHEAGHSAGDNGAMEGEIVGLPR